MMHPPGNSRRRHTGRASFGLAQTNIPARPKEMNKPAHTSHTSAKRAYRVHHDWRAWVVVALMLIAMAIYVVTNNEADQPGEQQGLQVPAAASAE
jgi:hypothetical protein